MITVNDYERAIYYVMANQWDQLILLMDRTNDDFLAKRIQVFLHRYFYSPKDEDVIESHDNLLNYIDHAIGQSKSYTIKL
mgnify:CR=1 FL=1